MSEDCGHPEAALRAYRKRDNSMSYARQCTACGERVGPWVKKADALAIDPDPPPWDHSIVADLKQATLEKNNSERAVRRAEFKALYADYLRSPEWRRRRDLVMKRAGGMCEGCGERPASEVHHLTYGDVGCEFLWQLVAVCGECHGRAHEDYSPLAKLARAIEIDAVHDGPGALRVAGPGSLRPSPDEVADPVFGEFFDDAPF